MPYLVELDFSRVPLDDAVLSYLGTLEQLANLYLEDTTVGDADLEKLAAIANLRELRVVGTQVAPDGLARFRPLRPDVTLLERRRGNSCGITARGQATAGRGPPAR